MPKGNAFKERSLGSSRLILGQQSLEGNSLYLYWHPGRAPPCWNCSFALSEGQVQVPCSSQSLLTTLGTCSSPCVYNCFQPSSSNCQVLCLHLPNNICVLTLKNHQATTCWLQETMPITGKCNSLPYLGQTSPTTPGAVRC